MAVIPINLVRVSQNLRAFNLLESVRRNQADLFRVQNQLATGLKVIKPSDEPISAAAAGALDRRLDLIKQIERNLLHVNNVLTESESAMNDAVDLLMEVQTIASETVGDTSSTDERSALANIIDSTLDQLVSIGNRRYMDTYLFAGHYGNGLPFEQIGDGVLYHGDNEQAYSIVDTDRSQDTFTLSGAEFFNSVSTAVEGVVDLDPNVTVETRISELRGTTGNGVTLGRIVIGDGSEEVQIDLSRADTVGDLLDKLNEELPATLQATLGGQSITISTALGTPMPITIRDTAGGQTVRDLGLSANNLLTSSVAGADLDPQLTLRTQLTDLNSGTGLDLSNGLIVTNGSKSATLDFTGAETMEDIMNVFNQADVNVWARIAADGRTIEVVNRVSGSDLTIGENGGQLATSLGIRSMYTGTKLTSLNDGRGIETVEGNDIRIITADNTTIEVDLDGAETLQDVIDLLNTAGGGTITVGLNAVGNGLFIRDNSIAVGPMRIERANLSPALDGLGLSPITLDTSNIFVGEDNNPVRTDSVFTGLVELRTALLQDDRQGISWAGERLENALKRMQEVQGQMAAHAKAMDSRNRLVESEVLGARIMLSDVRDADMTEAVVQFQQMQTALQANLSTASRVMNLTLLDFLS